MWNTGWDFGREVVNIGRASLFPSRTPFRPIGLEFLRMVRTGRRLEVQTPRGWEPLPFTGQLLWYAGMGIDLVSEFNDGVLVRTRIESE